MFFIGEIIPLTIKIKQGPNPVTGLTVTVVVTEQTTAIEKLASTVVPETSDPGVYSFPWGSAPGEESDLLITFFAQNRTFEQFIKIRRKESVEEIQEVSVEVLQDQKVDVVINQPEVVSIEVQQDEPITISVVDQTVTVEVKQEDTIDVIIQCA